MTEEEQPVPLVPQHEATKIVRTEATVEYALGEYFPKFNVRPELLTKKENLKGMLAEFVAMIFFVWIGCGTAISIQAQQTAFGPAPIANDFVSSVSMAFGFGISVLAYCIAPVSGGHINPAVTFALWLVRDIGPNRLVLFTLAQFFGAFIGALILWGCVASDELGDASGTNPPFTLASNFLNPATSVASGFLIEVMGTFLLVFTVLMTAVFKKNIADNMAPAAIGWSVMLAHFVMIPFTGCGINPARSFGPHMVSIIGGVTVGERGWWIYYTAPYVGSFLAAMLFKTVYQLPPDMPVATASLVPAIAKTMNKMNNPLKSKNKAANLEKEIDAGDSES